MKKVSERVRKLLTQRGKDVAFEKYNSNKLDDIEEALSSKDEDTSRGALHELELLSSLSSDALLETRIEKKTSSGKA